MTAVERKSVSTINGLPAHVLLVHFIVVLAPLTALLALMCAVWPAARRRLVWLVLALAALTTVLTPLTTEAGEWLEHHLASTPAIERHAELGDSMLFFSAALLVAALLLAFLHVRAARERAVGRAVTIVASVVVVVASVATMVQVYRIGDSGAQSAWADAVSGQPESADGD